MITKLDRLGRSLEHLIALSKQLQAKGVDFVVLDQARDGAPAKRPYLAVSSSLRNSTGTAQPRARHPVRAGPTVTFRSVVPHGSFPRPGLPR